MATYDLRNKTNASSGQQLINSDGSRKSYTVNSHRPGHAVGIDAFNTLEKKVQEQDTKLDKILKLLENK